MRQVLRFLPFFLVAMLADSLVAQSAPTITSVAPTTAVAGTQVTITGTGFGASQGSGNVWLGNTYGVVNSWSDTQVVAAVASGAQSGTAKVLQGGVWSNAVTFTVSAAPSISSLSPNSGAVGTSVTITGTNFGTTQGTSTVTFNGASATPTSWSNTSIATQVPTGATTGSVVVTVGGQASNGVSFTVTVPPPTISALSPTSGPVGTLVTIAGTNFGSAQASSIVTFNGTSATSFAAWSNTAIEVTVPVGATTGNVVVTVSGNPSNAVWFTVPWTWANGYSYQRTITIGHTNVRNTDQINCPVLISGVYSYLATTSSGGNVTNSNGYDIIFTSDSAGANKLNFEQESYNPSTGAVNYWVKVPTLSHTTDTVIYMFYGNSGVTTDQSNKTAVWDSNYVGVWLSLPIISFKLKSLILWSALVNLPGPCLLLFFPHLSASDRGSDLAQCCRLRFWLFATS